MSNFACIILDPKYCINCKACEIHCAVWNKQTKPLCNHYGDLPYYENDIIVQPVEFFSCSHCAHPLCLKACKSGAMFLEEDATVRINDEKCTGCGDCIKACPTHIPKINGNTGKAVKCDLCADRRAVGEDPACVAGCPSRALTFSEDKNLQKIAMKKQLAFIKLHCR